MKMHYYLLFQFYGLAKKRKIFYNISVGGGAKSGKAISKDLQVCNSINNVKPRNKISKGIFQLPARCFHTISFRASN